MESRIFDRLTLLSDTTRSRLLHLLERHELSVGELCATVQLPQSTVSRHLKVLGDDGWVSWWAEGTTRRYRMELEGLDGAGRRLWELVREQLSQLPVAEQDTRRVGSVLAERRSRSAEFFSATAGEWDRVRSELFGSRTELHGLLGLLDPGWVVGDLGCGTGHVADVLSPFVRRVVAVDGSPEMLAAARGRLAGRENVELYSGALESLPLEASSLDVAILFLVLHYLAEPERALAEVARVVRAGGRVLVVDMTPHDRDEYRARMGHVWMGFPEERVREWLGGAGFASVRHTVLPADPGAKGPVLFTASAVRG
jgi:ubiquinone/menaquinone biosynthesis C-methylase UbiE/DNA-binding MarR family transcriptional regulator